MVFDLAGGSASFSTRQTVTKGQRCPRPTPDPTRAGYLFDGWFTGNTPVAYDFNKPVTDDTTLTAHWSPTSNDTQWSMTPNHGTTWGNDTVTLTPPPPRGLRFTQVSAGSGHSLGIGSDGNLYTWGNNQYGQLGRTTDIVPYSVPGLVDKPAGAPAGFTWTQAIAGSQHSMAFGSDGNLYTWGNNQYGQLGRTTNNGINTPNPTPGLVDKPTGARAGFTWTQASVGRDFSMAFGSDGNLYTWGNNQYGQLGRTTNNGTMNPNPVPGLVDKPTGATAGFTWTQATTGYYYSMAVGSDGNLYTWGENSSGQLGRTPRTGPNPTPRAVAKPTGATDGFTWTQATTGYYYSMAVGSDGNLYTWGENSSGQLGRTPTTGTSSYSPTPGPVDKPAGAPAGFTWTQADARSSMAFGSDGNLYTWGNNQYGQLGRPTPTIGTYNPNPTPGLVDKPAGAPAGFTWTQGGTAGGSMAFGSDGNLYTWGNNSNGQLGRPANNGTNNYTPMPGRVDFPEPAVPTGVVFGGKAGTSLIRNTDGTWKVTTPAHAEGLVDTVITWRRNGPQADAHLPYTYVTPSYTYVTPSYTVDFDPDGGAPKPPDQQITEGQRARRPADPVKAGYLFDGWFIGNTPTAYDFNKPVTEPVSLKAHWTSVSSQHWTISPDHGSELGGEQVTLTPPAPRGIRFTQVSAGQHHSLAIGSDGNLYSWGWNLSGQLGRTTANIGNYNSPNPTPGLVDKPAGAPAGFTWTRAIAGYQHSMALGSDGNLYTWGDNSNGQLGRPANNGTMNPNPTPGPVDKPAGAPAGFTWRQATAGFLHSMAVGSDGNLYTWGNNFNGELGRTSTNPNPTPGPVDKPTGAPAGFTWTQATAGFYHSMAVGSDGNLYTWGNNNHGELGRTTDSILGYPNPTPGPVDKPTGAPAGFTWTQATAGYFCSMALGSDGNLYTWGENSSGQLGRTPTTGTSSYSPTPGPVDKPAGAPAGFTWTQATTGGYNSMAFGSDGNLYTWGDNQFGQLGRTSTSPNPTPGLVDKPAGAPAGFTWTQATAGYWHSLTVGSDGNLYTWGLNSNGQLGRTTTSTSPNPTPGMVDFPGPAVPTGVRFGTTPGTRLAVNTDGTWRVTTPAHDPGTVTVTIDWTRNGVQPPDTGNRYEFRPIGVLPQAGGEGILPLLLIGLLAMATALVGRRHRQDTTTPTSHE